MKQEKLTFDNITLNIRRDIIKITGVPLLVGRDRKGTILIVTNPHLAIEERTALRSYVKIYSNPVIQVGLNFLNPEIIKVSDKKKRARTIVKIKIT